MKEDDMCELLKFERKMLRARISTLRNDKFIQVRLKMETGLDGKAQKVNYYFINYKVFTCTGQIQSRSVYMTVPRYLGTNLLVPVLSQCSCRLTYWVS